MKSFVFLIVVTLAIVAGCTQTPTGTGELPVPEKLIVAEAAQAPVVPAEEQVKIAFKPRFGGVVVMKNMAGDPLAEYTGVAVGNTLTLQLSREWIAANDAIFASYENGSYDPLGMKVVRDYLQSGRQCTGFFSTEKGGVPVWDPSQGTRTDCPPTG